MADYPDWDPEKYDAIRLSTDEWTLAHGTVTFRLPDAWTLTERLFDYAVFDIEGLDDVELMFRIEAFEDADRVAADDLGGFFELPVDEFTDPEDFDVARREDGSVDWSRAILRRAVSRIDRETGEPYAYAVVWRCINVLPPAHIRILTVVLTYPLDREIEDLSMLEDDRALIMEVVHELVRQVDFSPEPTTLDEMAATPELEAVWFDDIAAIRLPRGWKWQETPGKDGNLTLYNADAPTDDEWTLWAQPFMVNLGSADIETQARIVEIALEGFKKAREERVDIESEARFLDPEDPSIGYARYSSHETDENDGEVLRRTTWTVVKVGADIAVGLMVHWVVVEGVADQPRIRAFTEIIEREIPDAVILPDLAAALYG